MQETTDTKLDKTQTTTGVSLVEMFLKAKELERKGYDVIHFDAGEPDFEPPTEVVEATVRALKEGRGRYTESAGIPAAKKAVAEKLNRKYNQDITPSQVLITAGGRLALYYAFLSLPKGSTVGIVTPDWPAYRELADFLGMPIHYFKTNLRDRWDLDPDEIRRSDCGVLVLNYPNNPTGKMLDLKKFEQIMAIAAEKKTIVISDEVYSDYIFDPAKNPYRSIIEFPDVSYMLVTSLSKSYAMTGFRAGYVVSNSARISQLTKLNSLIVTSMPEFVQYSVIAAMSCDDYVREKVDLISKRRDTAARALKKYLGAEFYLPDGAMYVFPRLRSLSSKEPFDSESFASRLLESQHVSVTPGTSFGSSFRDYVRMTLLQSEKRIEEGIERMSREL